MWGGEAGPITEMKVIMHSEHCFENPWFIPYMAALKLWDRIHISNLKYVLRGTGDTHFCEHLYSTFKYFLQLSCLMMKLMKPFESVLCLQSISPLSSEMEKKLHDAISQESDWWQSNMPVKLLQYRQGRHSKKTASKHMANISWLIVTLSRINLWHTMPCRFPLDQSCQN